MSLEIDGNANPCQSVFSVPAEAGHTNANAAFAKRFKRGDKLNLGIFQGYTHLSVEDGCAFSYLPMPTGNRQVIDFHLPGDLVPLTTYERFGRNHVTKALSELSIKPVLLDSARCLEISQANEARLITWLVGVGNRTAYQRLAHLVCELYVRAVGAGLATGRVIRIPVFQEHLGSALGLTSVHVNRMFRRLKADGLARAGIGRVEILDLEQLQTLAGFDVRYLTTNRPEAQKS